MRRNKAHYEYLRVQAKQKFDQVRSSWIDCGRWALPHRTTWLLAQLPGERRNQHIVDSTHVLALRSYVAGFLEGNTSATRPWFRIQTSDPEINAVPENKKWLQALTRQTLKTLTSSNFYHAAGEFYYDFGVFNTGGHFIDEIKGKLFFHTLMPGSYYVINNGLGEVVVLVREFQYSVKALVETYGEKRDGNWIWSNFSSTTKKMYDDGNYTQMIDVVQVIELNDDFDPNEPQINLNKQWISKTYELHTGKGEYVQEFGQFVSGDSSERDEKLFLKVSASKRKPFIVGKSLTQSNYEYGTKGPTSDALGLIKSLNKKAIGKDRALEQMLKPALQGPANLKKSYITTAANKYVPLDAFALQQKGMRPIFEINPAIGSIIEDVSDLRDQVDKLYYADFLLFLSRNPKTRTATETDAVVNEQQLVIGPNLQSLNWTYNVPVVDFVMDYTLDEDDVLGPPPDALAGQFLRPEFISVFAQAQRAADLPSVDRYVAMVAEVSQIDPSILFKANLDKLADIYEDRLYLPEGLNRPQDKADALKQQAMAERERQQKIEQMTQMAGAAKDIGQANKGEQR